MENLEATKNRDFHILIVEDNEGDTRLLKEIFKRGNIQIYLDFVQDGIEAIDFLRNNRNYVNAKKPDLIILDLNLPRMNGREVLTEIKKDTGLMHIPVVILTMSNSEDDIIQLYNLHANCFITKPIDYNQFVKVIMSIEDFWFSVVSLYPKDKLI